MRYDRTGRARQAQMQRPFTPTRITGCRFWGDPGDVGTLSQDANFTIPVSAGGQQVGMWLDKSQAVVLGPELVINGGFDDGTASWQPRRSGVLTNPGGRLRVTNGGAVSGGADQAVTTVPGRVYRVGMQVVAAAASQFAFLRVARFNMDTANVVDMLVDVPARGVGHHAGLFRATTTTSFVFAQVNGGALTDSWVEFDTLSIREVAGNHAQQITAPARPLYQVSPPRLVFDNIDDLHTITFPTSLGSNCTVARAIPGVGAQILAGQTIGTTFTTNVTNAQLVIYDRALNAVETAKLTAYLNRKAAV
jgi:hypothetical protein